MRPLSLTVENFAKYRGEHQLDFSQVNLAVLTGPNGAGKSTLAVDSIRWALFGATHGSADSVINDQEDRCRVELGFALGEEQYLVSRQRSRKGGGKSLLSFQMLTDDGPVVLDGKGIGETQQNIINTLHLTDELFCMTACVSQGRAAAFSEARPAERKAVLAHILDLDQWERRAELARQMVRDIGSKIERTEQQLEQAKATAAEAHGIGEELAELGTLVEAAETGAAEKQTALTKAQEAKANLTADQEADRAQRRELQQLGEQREAAEADVATGQAKVARLQSAAEGADKARKALADAQAAQYAVAAYESVRAKDEALRHEAELLEQAQKAEIAERVREIEALKQHIDQTAKSHKRELASFGQRVKGLTEQALPLERIPCTGTEYESQCPLIELARKAKASLPDAEAELAAALELDPTAMDVEHLAELESAPEGQEQAPRLEQIDRDRKALAYDADDHAGYKRTAERLGELQKRLTEIQAAEMQIADAESELETDRAKAAKLTMQRDELAEKLGKPRNWDAMISAVAQMITDAQSAIAAGQARIQELGQKRGGLEERLRNAELAAEDAKRLAEELRAAQKRLKLLKILVRAFGKAGIPALLIEQAIPDLEALANDVLSTLSAGGMSLTLESQRETQSKSLVETLDIMVSDVDGQRAYETFSGGERMRVDLAVRIGLSVLLANRHGAQVNMLVVDEACAPLDEAGQDLFVECLSRATEWFSLILCITHIERLREVFATRLAVSRDADGSHVELIAA